MPPFNTNLIFQSTINVERAILSGASGSWSETFSGVYSGIPASVQPVGTGESLNYGRKNTDVLYNIYVPGTYTVLVTDKIVFGTTTLTVIEVSNQISLNVANKIVCIENI